MDQITPIFLKGFRTSSVTHLKVTNVRLPLREISLVIPPPPTLPCTISPQVSYYRAWARVPHFPPAILPFNYFSFGWLYRPLSEKASHLLFVNCPVLLPTRPFISLLMIFFLPFTLSWSLSLSFRQGELRKLRSDPHPPHFVFSCFRLEGHYFLSCNIWPYFGPMFFQDPTPVLPFLTLYRWWPRPLIFSFFSDSLFYPNQDFVLVLFFTGYGVNLNFFSNQCSTYSIL